MSIRILLFCILLWVNGCSSANQQFTNDEVERKVVHYMEDVFGVKSPSLTVYKQYQGDHSEDEYEQELIYCIEYWSDKKDIKLEAFVKNIPKQCTDWLIQRSTSEVDSESLFYKKIRSEFSNFPVKYLIRSITKSGSGYRVNIDIESGGMLSLTVMQAIDEPNETRIFINPHKGAR